MLSSIARKRCDEWQEDLAVNVEIVLDTFADMMNLTIAERRRVHDATIKFFGDQPGSGGQIGGDDSWQDFTAGTHLLALGGDVEPGLFCREAAYCYCELFTVAGIDVKNRLDSNPIWFLKYTTVTEVMIAKMQEMHDKEKEAAVRKTKAP